jgi:hypothetical protein
MSEREVDAESVRWHSCGCEAAGHYNAELERRLEAERQVILWREAAKSRLAAAIKFERERAEQQARAEKAEMERDAVSRTATLMTSYARQAEEALGLTATSPMCVCGHRKRAHADTSPAWCLIKGGCDCSEFEARDA